MSNANTFPIFNPLLLKVLVMEVFRQEGTCTTGEYGLQLLLLKTTKLQSEDSTVSLEHNLCLFGKQFYSLLTQIVDTTNLSNYNSMKNIQANSTL